MRIVLFGNGGVAATGASVVRACGDEIVAVVVHAPQIARDREAIVGASGTDIVLEKDDLASAAGRERLAGLLPDIGLSIHYGFILGRPVRSLFPRGVVNLHPALLPYNRGAYPNVWTIVDRTPAGATLHFMDDGIDTGDVIAQREIPVEQKDTGKTLYHRLEEAAIALLRDTWPRMRSGDLPRRQQPTGSGSFHRRRDVDAIDRIDLDATHRAGDLIDVLRARTFAPYPGAYVEVGGRRLYLRLQLLEEAELDQNE